MAGKSELKINSKFAVKYEKYRQKEELQRLKDRYGDQVDDSESRSSDSESDDESEVELDPKLDRDFYRTLSLLKKKDPKIYQEDAKFYADEDPSVSDAQPSTSKKAEKPMFLKDYERKVILERGGKYDDDDESDDEEAAKRRERAASPSYMQEQRELKASFQKFVQDSDEEAGEGEEEFKLLKRRIKTQEEKDKEEEDYVDWLKGAGNDGQEEVQDLKHLRDYWNDPELDDKERFLRDFVLNKGYMEKDEERIPSYEEVLQDDLDDSEEEGEAFLERQEDFEREYNFRFEEPDATKIKTYPRTIATSVRSKDERRKLKRDEVKERKTKEKEQKHEQLKMLKNLKGKEIMEKLQRLKQLTGNEQLAFSQMDLEGDFDPQQHDQLMQKFFGDQYYGEDEGEKPQFDEEELEEHWNWDTWTGEGEDKEHVEAQEYGGEEEEGGAYGSHQPDCEDPDFIMDADYDPSQPSTSKKQKRKEKKKLTKEDAPLMGKKRKKSHFAEVITQNKPVFDPQEKNFEQYLDEYYRLDYEDIIDDLPCRFRYRQVLANDFGLSTDEILGADEKELNRWCSLKKTCMFRSDKEEMSDLKNYIIKANNVNKKKEVLSSFYSETDKDQAEGKNKVGKKRRDRIKNAEKEDNGPDEDSEAGPSQATSALDSAEGTVVQALKQAGEEGEEFLVPKKKMKLEEEKIVTAVKETAGAVVKETTGAVVKETTGAVVKETTGAVVKETTEEAKPRTERPKWPKKKQRHSGGRLMPGPFRVRMGGREFSGQRLRAYGLNPKRLHFRQLGRQKRKEINKAEKQKSKK